ncbi:alpha/beta hydrolase fold family protein [Paraburkholderia xenovorans LB400]|uniref:Esterase/lipase n=1 Tax=Paraburkholderia xenovorans (strain LB400) TaxID=266265 RepID=Q143V6_PARXL|nr:alpha/beta hydrolase [Paraburkholderia xenovorans]ABE29383.1 Putative esterase/lipase [Paraburkholderia xenovorans LB400]AIP33783.1 alpha/beta hydrolase fold family protein [Paraburkholderia xenovorans LB400]
MEPELKALIEQLSQAGRRPFWQCTVDDARNAPTLVKRLFPDAPSVERTQDIRISSTRGHAFPARLYVPRDRPCGLIVYLHGGGWVVGSVDDYHPLTATITARSGFAVLSVDYRLAPEHAFPIPLEDARAALEWASSGSAAVAIGADVNCLIVMGDSAGANLATVAARLHNEKNIDRRVDGQVLVYPVTGHDFKTASYDEFAEGNLLTRNDMQWFWDHYCPERAARANPLASPLEAEDLSMSPPALVMTAGRDPLRDEGEAYGARLRKAGVDVAVVRCDGLVHGFLAMIHQVPGAARAFDRIVDYITRLGEAVPEARR